MSTQEPTASSKTEKSGKWLVLLLLGAAVSIVLAFATIRIGAVTMTGTAGIPGPGFFLFGLLSLLLFAAFVLLLIRQIVRHHSVGSDKE